MKCKEFYGRKYLFPKEYLTMPDDAVVQGFPRQDIHIVVVGGDATPMVQGWHMTYPSAALVDKWR